VRPRDLTSYVTLSVVWGVSFAVLQRVVHAFGWAGAVSFRALIAGTILLIIAAITRRKLDFSVGLWPFAVVGATTVAAQLIGMSFALPRIGSAMAAIFVATIPLFSMLIGQLWRIEKITAPGRIGLLLGASGIVLLVGFPAAPITGTFLLGCAAALTGSVAAAFGSNYARKYLEGVSSWDVTIGSFLCGGLMTLPLLLVMPVPRPPSLADFGYLVFLAAVMSSLAYVLYFRLVADLGPTRALSVEFFVTTVAVLVGTIGEHEHLSPMQFAGAVVIITGCTLVLGLTPRRRATSRADA
jgi:drug/metabolite transporter (DMT)-like permease